MTDPAAARLHVVAEPASAPQPEWEARYREHVGPVYRFTLSRVGNRPDAEDLTAQVFLRALPKLRSAASASEVSGYLFATARTVLADFWRREYSCPTTTFDEGSGTVQQDTLPTGSPSTGARAAELLERLPAREREVLELRFLRGYSIRETATAMAVTVANAKVMQWRALRRAAGLTPEEAQ